MGMLVLCQDLYGAAGVATKARDGALGQTERRRIMSETPPPPLPVPWLAHEQFAVTKKVCSSRDGLSNVKKSAVVRVVQELKKGRAHVDHQLSQLERQLVQLSDFLGGTSANMFPAQPRDAAPVPPVVPNGWAIPTAVDATASGSLRTDTATGAMQGGATDKTAATSDKTNPLLPLQALVEDDLASDAPCATRGLWKYLEAYSICKPVTLSDMENGLQLEDPTPCESAEGSGRWTRLQDLMHEDGFSLDGSGRASTKSNDEMLQERLLASLLPSQSAFESPKADDPQMSEAEMKTDPNSLCMAPRASASCLTNALRSIGLLEVDDVEVNDRLTHPQDDEVSSEIRYLESVLVAQTRRNNETKRVLRKLLQTTQPWLSHEQEMQEAAEKKYLTMWRRKKEAERKRKIKEKKLMRREALTPPQAASW